MPILGPVLERAAAVAVAIVVVAASPARASAPTVHAAPADAAPPPARTGDAAIERLVEELGSSDWSTRERAGQALRVAEGFTVGRIEETLARPGLDAERRARLHALGEERFRGSPRGALGVRFAMERFDQRGLEIAAVFPTFPAAKVLQAKDVILAINGVGVADSIAVRPLIISRDPGDVLRVRVLREGEIVDVEAPLGDFARLGQPNQPTDLTLEELRRAWLVRSAGWPRPQPVLAPVGADDVAVWANAGPLLLRERRERGDPSNQSSLLLAAGQPQAGRGAVDRFALRGDAFGEPEGRIVFAPNIQRPDRAVDDARREVEVRNLIATMQAQLLQTEQAMEKVEDPEARRGIEDLRTVLKIQLQRLVDELQTVQARRRAVQP